MNRIKKIFSKNKIIILLGAVLLIFDVFAFAKAVPINSQLPAHEDHLQGDYDRKVYRVFDLAKRNAEEPFMEDYDNFLFHGRNPGMFLFVNEMYARLGVRSPVVSQIISILMFNVGLIVNYLWVKDLFGSKRKGLLSVFFLATTPYLLVHSSSIHVEPYEFLFFNLTVLLFTRFLNHSKRSWDKKYLALTALSYFILTQNYYMFYVSTFVVMIGIVKYKTGKWFHKSLIVLALVPIISVSLVFAQAVVSKGDLNEGTKSITEIAVARTVDARLEGSEWYPDETFVTFDDYANMPQVISERVRDMFYLTPVQLLLMFAIATILLAQVNKSYPKYTILMPIFLLAGISWNVIFYQHTFIHKFTGLYGFFAWAVIFAFSIDEIYTYIDQKFEKEELLTKLFIFFSIISPFAFVYLNGFANLYIKYLHIYIKNIIELI